MKAGRAEQLQETTVAHIAENRYYLNLQRKQIFLVFPYTRGHSLQTPALGSTLTDCYSCLQGPQREGSG